MIIPLTVGIILACGSYYWYCPEHTDLRLRATLENHPGSGDLVTVEGFSPDGSKVVTKRVSDSDEVIAVWDTRSGQIQTNIRLSTLTSDGMTSDAVFLGFSPHGRIMATASADDGVKLWDSTTWQIKRAIDLPDVQECHFVSENTVILVTGTSELTAWDITTGRKVATLLSWDQDAWRSLSTRISADRRRITAAIEEEKVLGKGLDTRLRVLSWSTSTWQMQGSTIIILNKNSNISISPDEKRIACVNKEGEVEVWDADLGRKQLDLHIRPGKRNTANSWYRIYAWAPGGASFLALDDQGTMHLCDPRKQVVRTLEGQALPLAFTDSSPVFSFSIDGHVLFSLSSRGNSRNAWLRNLPSGVQGVAKRVFGEPKFWTSFQLKFENMARGSLGEQTLRDVRWITSARIDPAGSTLAVSVPRGQILLYDLPEELKREKH